MSIPSREPGEILRREDDREKTVAGRTDAQPLVSVVVRADSRVEQHRQLHCERLLQRFVKWRPLPSAGFLGMVAPGSSVL